MSLPNIGLCHLDPINRAAGTFEVTINSADGQKAAIFSCSSEHDAIKLRNAIRDHADQLRRVFDYS